MQAVRVPNSSQFDSKLLGPATQKYFGLLCLLLLPLIGFLALNISPINQAGGLDPYIYTGYINNFDDLTTRYGLTYYGVRFGLIFPARLLTYLLGPENGYFALRYLLALTAGLPFYFITKKLSDRYTAWVVYICIVTSPFLARTLLWDHPDAAGVPFLSAGAYFMLAEGIPWWLASFCSGIFFGLAFNCNIFTAAIAGIFWVCWTIAWFLYKRSWTDIVRRFSLILLAIVGVCIGGAVYYHKWLLVWDIYTPTLKVGAWLVQGGMQRWRVPGIAWIGANFHVTVPIVLLLSYSVVTKLSRLRFIETVLLVYALAVTVFYYVFQFSFKANSLQLFYYFSYSIPAVFGLLALLYGRLLQVESRTTRLFLAVASVVALALPWILKTFGANVFAKIGFLQYALLVAFALPVFLACRGGLLSGKTRVAAQFLALVLLGLILRGFASPVYASLVRPRAIVDNSELDIYRVSLKFARAVPKLNHQPGVVRFWYNNRIGNPMNSVQSTYLWGFSKCNQDPPADPGMPHVGPFQAKLFHDPQLKYLCLLGENKPELKAGLAAVSKENLSFEVLDHEMLKSGNYEIEMECITLLRP